MLKAGIDYGNTSSLASFFNIAERFTANLNDSEMAGSEASISSLKYYNSLELADKNSIAGTRVIYEDLKKCFFRGKKTPPSS
jgi:hypothetical protein